MKISSLMTLSATILLVASIGLSVPANARTTDTSSTKVSQVTSALSNSSSVATASKAKPADKKICMKMEPLTGSRMVIRACKTKSEWENLGYEFNGGQ